MTCVHLKKLYQLCETYDLRLSSSDVIRVTCPECGLQETCPSVHLDDCDEQEDVADSRKDAATDADV